jgi:acyl-coenzyme A synthetase/AMP-(fatty) acid ligase
VNALMPGEGREGADRFLWAADASVSLHAAARGTSFDVAVGEIEGRSVLLATPDQLSTALALIELDGVARRLVLCPPDLPHNELTTIANRARADTIVCGRDRPPSATAAGRILRVTCSPVLKPSRPFAAGRRQTEWVLLTSGTSGVPKMVVHTLASLTAAIKIDPARKEPMVWGTFYDIRRYGGLQIFLRAILGGSSLVLSSEGEPMAEHLHRLGSHGVTHLSGTPSHWRWAILSPAARAIAPRYVRLSGEIADQAILDALREFYPSAAIGHAYASTEAGVGFEVNDGREGFPASLLEASNPALDMKVVDGSLRIRSKRTAARYLGHEAASLLDLEGFVDTGDIVERRGERCFFVGRRGGIINVGGLKVHPEEVEGIINRHPEVRMSLVRARKNPITGAIVVADVVLKPATEAGERGRIDALKREILEACRDRLPQHKVPAAIRFVASLEVSAAGKMARDHA